MVDVREIQRRGHEANRDAGEFKGMATKPADTCASHALANADVC